MQGVTLQARSPIQRGAIDVLCMRARSLRSDSLMREVVSVSASRRVLAAASAKACGERKTGPFRSRGIMYRSCMFQCNRDRRTQADHLEASK